MAASMHGPTAGSPSSAEDSTSHAAWDLDAVHGMHAMYSVSNLGTAFAAVLA
jgi:hypothetical protein